MEIVFITSSHKNEILEACLLKSPVFKYKIVPFIVPFIIQRGYTNVPMAYNNIKKDNYGIFIYLHHDVYLPSDFEYNLIYSLNKINEIDNNWAVLGVAGIVYTSDSKEMKIPYGGLLDRGVDWPGIKNLPHEVDTLDECFLITHGDFIFDENIPGNHFYGTDICLQAKKQGRKCYAIDAYIHHNSKLKVGERPLDFYPAQEYIRNKWKEMLPIATTCTVIK